MENLNELNLSELTLSEMVSIDAGGFWGDVAYGIGYAAGSLYRSLRDIEPQVAQRW